MTSAAYGLRPETAVNGCLPGARGLGCKTRPQLPEASRNFSKDMVL